MTLEDVVGAAKVVGATVVTLLVFSATVLEVVGGKVVVGSALVVPVVAVVATPVVVSGTQTRHATRQFSCMYDGLSSHWLVSAQY